jgi:hypothetical protein
MRHRAACRDAVVIQQRPSGEVRHDAARLADADIGRCLTEMHGYELRVQVGEVHQRHLADRVEAQQVSLGRPGLAACRRMRAQRRQRGAGGHQIAT